MIVLDQTRFLPTLFPESCLCPCKFDLIVSGFFSLECEWELKKIKLRVSASSVKGNNKANYAFDGEDKASTKWIPSGRLPQYVKVQVKLI